MKPNLKTFPKKMCCQYCLEKEKWIIDFEAELREMLNERASGTIDVMVRRLIKEILGEQ